MIAVIPLDQAPQGYKDFDKGAAKKFVLDPHGSIPQHGPTVQERAASRNGARTAARA